MHLQKIEIQGFKSFANKTSMEFNRGIAAIVGPNGSGKSNVADAIRWVMGEQSLKILRGKKSEDVIFSGSDKKARLGMAEVTLHINNEDGAMPIDYPEVAITRRVYRNGEAEYLLNKQRARLQDIILLLAKSNFGQRSYSVIGQGMIDSILTSSPQERKDFFDEAAGVRQFQIKREQAEQKLERTKDNLRQADLLMQEIEPRLRSLTRQVRRLERRETIESELRTIQKEYYSNLWKEISDELSKVQNEQSTANQKHQQAAASLKKVQQELETLEKEISREETFRQLQKEYNRILDQKNSLLQDQAVHKARWEIEAIQAGEVNRVWLEKRIETLNRLANEIVEDLKPLQASLKETQKTLDAKRSEQAKIVSQFEEIEKRLLLAKERLESKKSIGMPEIQGRLTEIQNSYIEFIARLDRATTPEDVLKLKRAAREIQTSLNNYIKELGRSAPGATPEEVLILQSELTNFLKSKDSLVNEINELTVKLRTLQEKGGLLQNQQNEVEGELNHLKKEIDQIDQQSKLPAQARESYEKDSVEMDQRLHALDQELKVARVKITEFNQEEQKKKDHLFNLQKRFRDEQNSLNAVTQTLNELRVKQVRLETRLDDLDREMKEETPEPIQQEIKADFAKLIGQSSNSLLLDKIHQLKHQLELTGGIDENVTGEYSQTNERYTFLKTQSDDLNKAIASLEQAITDLDETIKRQFDESFQKISKEFTKYFKMLFRGGNAKLILQKTDILAEEESDDDSEDEEAEEKEEAPEPEPKKVVGKIVSGIEIQATPPGKRLSNVNVLSGGEKALTSIALICAIIAHNPSPFVVLDEVDAALDESNSIKFSSILDELSHKTQFITITHNRATMTKANILYGVTMQSDGVSKLLSVKMEEAEEVIKRHGNR
ncbi:MAG: AAA family ATPase [Patescibacteria group bacterium]|nr:AAA family ATPase [Patescibacteria group bacterium]